MKPRLLLAALGTAALLVANLGWNPAVGAVLYDTIAATEAQVYGLHTERHDLGELTMVVNVAPAAPGQDTVVMLHGYSADKRVWSRFARHLIGDYGVVIPDLAGHGETGFSPDWDYRIPAQAVRVMALLDAMGIERAHVIGNSMGGFTAAHVARLFPGRTLSVTLVDPAGITAPTPSEMDRMIARGHNPFLFDKPSDFDTFYPMSMAKPPPLPPSILGAIAQSYVDRRGELDQIFGDFYGRDMLDGRLHDIDVPALVVWGQHDRLIDVSAAEVWARDLPQAEALVFEDLGHMPMVEDPAGLAEAYRAFLTDVATRSEGAEDEG